MAQRMDWRRGSREEKPGRKPCRTGKGLKEARSKGSKGQRGVWSCR